jgi:hypothetical protein
LSPTRRIGRGARFLRGSCTVSTVGRRIPGQFFEGDEYVAYSTAIFQSAIFQEYSWESPLQTGVVNSIPNPCQRAEYRHEVSKKNQPEFRTRNFS